MTYAQRVLIVPALFLIPVFQAVGEGTDDINVASDRVGYSACLVNSVSALSRSELKNLISYYIIPEFNQEGALHNPIADTLLQSGLKASIGVLDDMPEDIDILVVYRSHWDYAGVPYPNKLVMFFRAPSTNELLGVAQLYSQDRDTSMAPVYVRQSIAELLRLFEQPEGAPQC